MMSGRINSFFKSYIQQQKFQERVTGAICPGDNLEHFKYQFPAMIEELGEVAKADKRWKTHRNTQYEPNEKIDEIADVFIVAMNMAIHSGLRAYDVERAIHNKVEENFRRLELKEGGKQNVSNS